MAIVIVNGTNGSGKSTLARTVIDLSGGIQTVYELRKGVKVTVCNNGVCVLGEYNTACGGLDKFKSWDDIEFCIDSLKSWGVEHILGEGVINFGYNRYLSLNEKYNNSLSYLRLDTPIRDCIQNVIKRRTEAGNLKEFDPKNVYEKDKGMYGLYINLLMNGLEKCYSEKYETCLTYIKVMFSLGGNSSEHNN